METRNELQKFHHSVGVLVTAFFDGTLRRGNYCCCAVGNLVASALGVRLLNPYNGEVERDDLCLSNGTLWYRLVMTGEQTDIGFQQIQATGYSLKQIKKIENEFEEHSWNMDLEQGRFNGLMAVVDVLAEIHGVDLSVKESAKLLFVKS